MGLSAYRVATGTASWSDTLSFAPAAGYGIGKLYRLGRVDDAAKGIANLLDEIGLSKNAQRALLREAMQSNGTGKIAHHLIPLEALTRYKSLMERAARGGFNINGRNNGILYDAIDHYAGHPAYNRIVLEKLGQIRRQARRLSDSDVAALIQDAADTLRRASESVNGTFRPWF